MAAAELPRVELGDALRIVEVFAQDEALFDRAAVRWLGRFCLEAPDATLDDVQAAADGLAAVGEGVPGGLGQVADLCRGCGVRGV